MTATLADQRALPGLATTSRGQVGLSLVELMVAVALGLILLVTIGTILFGSLEIFRTQRESARIQETGRFVMQMLGRQISQAGYAAITDDYSDATVAFSGTPIQGEHGVVSIRTGERKSGSDYLAISYDGALDCQGDTPASGTVQNEYYLNNADEFVCVGSSGSAATIADSVEQFQVLYGLDSDSDLSVDRYSAQPTDWSQVRTARVCLVVRAVTLGTSPVAQRYEDCSGTTVTAPDTRLRRVFAATYELRNRGM